MIIRLIISSPYFFDRNVNRENFMNFLGIVYYNYLKTLIFIHDRECGYNVNALLCGKSESLSYGSGIQWQVDWTCTHRIVSMTSWFDFFLWMYTKNIFYEHAPTNRKDMMNMNNLQEHTMRCLTRKSQISKISWCYVFKPTEIILNSSFDRGVCEFLTRDTTPVHEVLREKQDNSR